jgi:hypothetical protein
MLVTGTETEMLYIWNEKIKCFQLFLKIALYLVRYIPLKAVLDDTPVSGDLPVRVRVLAQLGQHAAETEHPQRVPSGHPLHHRVGKQQIAEPYGYPNCAQYTTVVRASRPCTHMVQEKHM